MSAEFEIIILVNHPFILTNNEEIIVITFLFFTNELYFSQENSKEIIIPEVNLVDTVNSG